MNRKIALAVVNLVATLQVSSASFRSVAAAEKGQAALFVVDTSPEFAAMGGECAKFSTASRPGPSKRLLAMAKGAPRSVVVMVAFEAASDRLIEKLTPVVEEQTLESVAARMPSEASGEVWSFMEPDARADLFIVIGQIDDPRLRLIRLEIELIQATRLAETRLQAAAALRNRLTGLLRSQGSEAPARSIPSTLAAVRRGLSTLHEQWNEDSDPMSFEKDKPRVKLLKIGY